ncbi:MAG: class I SAM-dependent methyltransferase [Calditrichaeota bacterium]|nr:class I SAM-dependent methyltransferase [Calditrichota bacterium]
MKNKANFFFPIIDTWAEYFENPDEGLGTTYERFLLHDFFQRLKEEYKIESVLEAPSFGMTGVSGINSLWWGGEKIQTVVVDNVVERLKLSKKVWERLNLKAGFLALNKFDKLPFKDQSFDLCWNFAGLWFVNDLDCFLTEFARIARKVIFISIPNRFGLGYQIRLRLPGSAKPDLNFANLKEKRIIKKLDASDWKLKEKGYFDIPPWPDFPLKKEVLFDRLKLSFLIKRFGNKKNDSGRGMSILDYFSGERPKLKEEVLKFGFLEKAPFPIRQLWAHHRYLIFTKE